MDECLLYSEPELYDLLFPDARHAAYIDDDTRAQRLAASEQFYIEEARKGGGTVLELACGSGRLTIPIAQAGIEIVGLDCSGSMLDSAKTKAAAAAVAVTFVQSDMRSFELPRQFSTIIMAGNSLLHLLRIEDLQGCFNNVRRHLKPDGQFVFDVMNPNVQLLARDPAQRHPVLRVRDPKRGEITVAERVKYDAAGQIYHVTWFLSAPGAPEFRAIDYRLRVIFPQELGLLLQCSGFRMTTRYGEFTRERFESTSARQVCVCELS